MHSSYLQKQQNFVIRSYNRPESNLRPSKIDCELISSTQNDSAVQEKPSDINKDLPILDDDRKKKDWRPKESNEVKNRVRFKHKLSVLSTAPITEGTVTRQMTSLGAISEINGPPEGRSIVYPKSTMFQIHEQSKKTEKAIHNRAIGRQIKRNLDKKNSVTAQKEGEMKMKHAKSK